LSAIWERNLPRRMSWSGGREGAAPAAASARVTICRRESVAWAGAVKWIALFIAYDTNQLLGNRGGNHSRNVGLVNMKKLHFFERLRLFQLNLADCVCLTRIPKDQIPRANAVRTKQRLNSNKLITSSGHLTFVNFVDRRSAGKGRGSEGER
jgi:hypothetical protein